MISGINFAKKAASFAYVPIKKSLAVLDLFIPKTPYVVAISGFMGAYGYSLIKGNAETICRLPIVTTYNYALSFFGFEFQTVVNEASQSDLSKVFNFWIFNPIFVPSCQDYLAPHAAALFSVTTVVVLNIFNKIFGVKTKEPEKPDVETGTTDANEKEAPPVPSDFKLRKVDPNDDEKIQTVSSARFYRMPAALPLLTTAAPMALTRSAVAMNQLPPPYEDSPPPYQEPSEIKSQAQIRAEILGEETDCGCLDSLCERIQALYTLC